MDWKDWRRRALLLPACRAASMPHRGLPPRTRRGAFKTADAALPRGGRGRWAAARRVVPAGCGAAAAAAAQRAAMGAEGKEGEYV